jgi:hypothetical protein
MPTHRFKIGSAVTLNAEGPSAATASRYIVEAQMPPLGTQLQYRIKSEAEGFRRVVVEHQLAPFPLSPATTPSPASEPVREGVEWPGSG